MSEAPEGDRSPPGEPEERLRAMTERLRVLAEELADPEVGDERAGELAREASELVSRAETEIERALGPAEGEE